jgi:hypothetical protein
MARLDLDDANVKEESLTVYEIRNSFNDANALSELNDKLFEWLDEAQGGVFIDKHKEYYLVIKVTA